MPACLITPNHLPNIVKVFPDSISKRITNISSGKITFGNTSPFYNVYYLNYQKKPLPSNCVRQRNIIWFEPPKYAGVETNIGKTS